MQTNTNDTVAVAQNVTQKKLVIYLFLCQVFNTVKTITPTMLDPGPKEVVGSHCH